MLTIAHFIPDRNDIGQILDAMQHIVDMSTANLPPNRPVNDINWSGRLIISELQDWKDKRAQSEALLEMQLILQNINIARENADSVEYEVLNRMFEQISMMNVAA